ncbi:hypothetical protein [Streptomyces sp. NPDC004324]
MSHPLGDVLGLIQNPAGGPAYLPAVRPTNDADVVHPVLVKVTGHAADASSAAPDPKAPAADACAEVRRLAHGVKDYALEKFPLPDGKGGMGIVHEAVHKATGTVAALKKPGSLRENLTARDAGCRRTSTGAGPVGRNRARFSSAASPAPPCGG